MALATQPSQPDSLTDSGGVRSWINSAGFPLLIGTLGCLPLLIAHFQQLWARPHYQFFPMVFLAVAVLYHMRRSEPEALVRPDRKLIAGIAFLAGLALAGFAVLRISPLLCCGAWLLVVLATVSRSRFNLWAAWALMCLLLRLPHGKDVWLIQSLQRITTGIASNVLDQLHMDHIQEGNVLAFPNRKLLVEEACSGVVSLFTIIATAAILGAFLRRSFLHTILLVVAGAFWAAAANILRVVAIAFGIERLGVDLMVGWRHDALGLVIFCVTLVTLFSTDALLRFAFGPIELDETGSPEPIHDNWLVMLWNRAFWPRHERPAMPNLPNVVRQEPGPLWTRFLVLISTGFLTLGALQVWGGIGPFSRGLGIDDRIEQLSKESLPSQLAGWTLIEFKEVKRSASSEFGERSKQWTFTREGTTAIVSIDFPFPEWHDLDSCYRGVGWRTSSRLKLPGGTTAVQHALANDQQTGWLIFDMFDQLGQHYEPPLGTAIHPRWRRLLSGESSPWTLPTYYQVQVFSSRASLTLYEKARQEELQELFQAVRASVLQDAELAEHQSSGEQP